jgi:hypothetical protein
MVKFKLKSTMTVRELNILLESQYRVLTKKGNIAGSERKLRAMTDKLLSNGLEFDLDLKDKDFALKFKEITGISITDLDTNLDDTKFDAGDIKLASVCFDKKYGQLIPYEITFYCESLSVEELSSITKDEIDAIYSSFEENRASYAFSDCDDYPEPFDPDRNDLEIKTLIDDSEEEIDDIVNDCNEIDSDKYKFVLFYIYEDCDWAPFEFEIDDELNTYDLCYHVIWERIGDLKFINHIDIIKKSDNQIINTCHPVTDGSSRGDRYGGKIFFMLVDNDNQPITNKIPYDEDNILSAIKVAIN